MAAGSHYCTGCGQVHGADDQAAAVKIAKIQADRDIEVARIQRGETREVVEVNAETEIAVAEIGAAAGVEETAALAAGIADAGNGAAPAPAVITDVPAPDAEPEVQSITARDDETDEDGDDSIPPPASSGSKLRYWP
jgi:hypothetical protein